MKKETLDAAIARDPDALSALVRGLCPVIQGRVARALARRTSSAYLGFTPDAEDLVQEVFVALLDKDARALRAWDEDRGASLATFVGIIAERRVASILRTARRRPWVAEHDTGLDRLPARDALPEARAASRELGGRLLESLHTRLSSKGMELFYALLVDEEPVEAVCRRRGMSAEAVWAWRSRLKKLVRELIDELEAEKAAREAAVH